MLCHLSCCTIFPQVYLLTLNIWKVPNLKLKLFPALIWAAQSSSGYSTYLKVKYFLMQYWLFFISGSYQLRSRREWALLTVKYEIKWPEVAHSQTYQKWGRDGAGSGQPAHIQVVISLSFGLTNNQLINITILSCKFPSSKRLLLQ